MLVLGRRENQSLVLITENERIEITFLPNKKNKPFKGVIKLGIDCPKNVNVFRKELEKGED